RFPSFPPCRRTRRSRCSRLRFSFQARLPARTMTQILEADCSRRELVEPSSADHTHDRAAEGEVASGAPSRHRWSSGMRSNVRGRLSGSIDREPVSIGGVPIDVNVLGPPEPYIIRLVSYR